MNYTKHYDLLIEKYGLKYKPKEGYYERHHILPKSMGGSDCEENLVYLTGRQHFIAHCLLFKIYRNQKMAFALYAMKNSKNNKEIPNGKVFEEARMLAVKFFLENNRFKPDSETISKRLREYYSNEEARNKSSNRAFIQHGEFGNTTEKEVEKKRPEVSEKLLKEHHLAKQVHTPEGVFHSVRAAARHYQVCHKSILRRISSNYENYNEYYYITG
jgi:hypothetical protein